MATVQGQCDPRFERVRGVFEKSFETGEVGAAVAITLDGEPVVDLWGGLRRRRPHPAVAARHDRERLLDHEGRHRDLRASPRRARASSTSTRRSRATGRSSRRRARSASRCAGCSRISAGLPAVRAPLPEDALYDWAVLCEALAAETPWWEPGTKHGYHALTYGRLRRRGVPAHRGAQRRPLPRATSWRGPLGLDFAIGLPASEHARCAEMIPAPPAADGTADVLEQFSKHGSEMVRLAFDNPRGTPQPCQQRRAAQRRDPGGERPRRRSLARAALRRARRRRLAGRRARALARSDRARDHRAGVREGRRHRLPDALGARLHAAPRHDAARSQQHDLRPRRRRRLDRLRRSGGAHRLLLPDEPDAGRHHRRPARLPPDRALYRSLAG